MTQTKQKKSAPTTDRIAVAYQCPCCLGYSVHKASRALINRNRELGSKEAPVRAFCPNPLDKCETSGGGRGRRQIRLMSKNSDHRIAMVPKRQIKRLTDLCEALNIDLRADPNKKHSRHEIMSTLDPTYVKGMTAPLPFRLERDL